MTSSLDLNVSGFDLKIFDLKILRLRFVLMSTYIKDHNAVGEIEVHIAGEGQYFRRTERDHGQVSVKN